MTDAPLVRCEAVTRDYPSPAGEVPALRPVTLTVTEGSSLAVVGPSGSGKTTLLSLLGALDRPTQGDIIFGGVPYSSMSAAQLISHRRRHIGFVFQDSNLVRGMTVWENVALPLWINGWPQGKVSARVGEMLTRLGLVHRRGAYVHQLSAGEAQRAAIARALAHCPRLLLADEPTGNLDRDNARIVSALLTELATENHCAVVVATHDYQLAQDMESLLDISGSDGHDR